MRIYYTITNDFRDKNSIIKLHSVYREMEVIKYGFSPYVMKIYSCEFISLLFIIHLLYELFVSYDT